MKKLALVVIMVVVVTAGLSGCSAPKGYDEYFVSHASQQPYTGIEEVFRLSDVPELKGRNVTFGAYHEKEGVYLVQENIGSEENPNIVVGFATESELLMEPRFSAVLDIRGDYAIVVKLVAFGAEVNYRVGLVKFRGENKGSELGYNVNYSKSISQYRFLDDNYLAMLGDKDVFEALDADSDPVYTIATVYQYTAANGLALLEVGRLRIADSATSIQKHDNDLIVNFSNTVRFFDINDIKDGGEFRTKKELTLYDLTATKFTEANVSSEVYYLGNHWYIVNAIHTSVSSSLDYDMIKESDGVNYYLKIESSMVNSKSYKQSLLLDKVALVANQYNDADVRAMCELQNMLGEEEEDEETGARYSLYVPAAVPPSSMVRKGYSIVYYYYYDRDAVDMWPVSFYICNEKGEIDFLLEADLLFPLLMVDGYAVFNSDPTFPMPGFDAHRLTYYGTLETLAKAEDGTEYNMNLHHGGMTIATNITFNVSDREFTTYMGAFNEKGEIAVPFRYSELTPFFGDYATGSRIAHEVGVSIERQHYRVDKNGKETRLSNVYALKNGLVITRIDEQFGLETNAGTKLIDIKCDNVTVLDSYLTDGVFTTQHVLTIENGSGVLYRLTQAK